MILSRSEVDLIVLRMVQSMERPFSAYEFAAAIEEAVLEKVCAEVAEWQSRYVGDPRQKGYWHKCDSIEVAKKIYELPNHTDENGWEVRPLYEIELSGR